MSENENGEWEAFQAALKKLPRAERRRIEKEEWKKLKRNIKRRLRWEGSR